LYVLTLAMLALGVSTLRGHGQEKKKDDVKPDRKKVSELMRRKLEHAQKILEGITMNNFKMIAQHADDLLKVSKEVEWNVIRTAKYELFSDEFRRTATALVKHAKDKNLDGASLTYLEATLNCFNCHRYVRDVGWANPEP
jgi:hypothetical protein